jgi:VNT family MFS transporter (synaptic vesicle glycoprotein 2)
MARITKEDESKQKVPFEKAISMTGYGFFNILVLLATGGGLMCVIIETMCMMFIIPAAQCDLDLSLSEKGLLSSVSFIGVVVSSYMWGYLADTRGRKNILVVSLSISSLTTIICSIIPSSWLFIVLRFINGFFIGGASSVVYAYAGEFHDNHYRPKVISWMSTFVAFGNMYLPGLAWLILPDDWKVDLPFFNIVFRPWRVLLIVYTLPCLICALCLYYLPESPKFLLTQGKRKEALTVLRQMYVVNTRKEEDSYGVDELVWEELSDDDPFKKDYGMWKTMWKQTVPLFKGELLTKTLMMCFLQFGIFASNAGIVMWYPEILNRMSHYVIDHPQNDVGLCNAILEEDDLDSFNSTEVSYKVCKDQVKTQVFLVSVIMGVAYAFIYLFIGCVINTFGKKKLMIAFVVVTTITGLCSQFVYGYGLIQILIGIFLMGGAGIGITNAIAVDLFPTQVRGMALAVSLMFGRIGAMTGTNIVGPLIYNVCDYLFYFVAADHLALIIVLLLLPSKPRLPKLVT